MKPEAFEERTLEVGEWKLRLTSYKLGELFHCTADNVSPGAWLARETGATREEAEKKAQEVAERRLGRTKRHSA